MRDSGPRKGSFVLGLPLDPGFFFLLHIMRHNSPARFREKRIEAPPSICRGSWQQRMAAGYEWYLDFQQQSGWGKDCSLPYLF
jgi:hypothetical protein